MCDTDSKFWQHVIRGIVALAICGAFAEIITVGFWTLSPYPVLTEADTVSRIVNPQVMPGDYVQYVAHYCKHFDLTETISRELLDGFVLSLPTVTSNRPLGCHYEVFAVQIPEQARPGKYKLGLTIEYHPNPMRWVRYKYDTPEFEVMR